MNIIQILRKMDIRTNFSKQTVITPLSFISIIFVE